MHCAAKMRCHFTWPNLSIPRYQAQIDGVVDCSWLGVKAVWNEVVNVMLEVHFFIFFSVTYFLAVPPQVPNIFVAQPVDQPDKYPLKRSMLDFLAGRIWVSDRRGSPKYPEVAISVVTRVSYEIVVSLILLPLPMSRWRTCILMT